MRRHGPSSPEELGAPIAYLALRDGTPVYDAKGHGVGVVEHVMEFGGIFEGLIIHTHPLPGRHLYADVDEIAEIREHGVLLSVDRDELQEPRPDRPPSDQPESLLEARLRRAWDWLTGGEGLARRR
ncbi:MAG TPA: hypothetical protein VG294_15390 [Solirubrobacteraceae bacterium]|nr:hypothetical protein [Solirubrobacteraceae bacterium]